MKKSGIKHFSPNVLEKRAYGYQPDVFPLLIMCFSSCGTGVGSNKQVDAAIEALKEAWQEQYSSLPDVEDKHLEIVNTQVIKMIR